MVWFQKTSKTKFISCIVVFLWLLFFLGEMLGLYSVSRFDNNPAALFSAVQHKPSLLRKLANLVCYYIPCVLPLISFYSVVLLPAVLLCRGYLFACSISAASYLNADDTLNLVFEAVCALIHTTSLIVLSAHLLYFVLIKKKLLWGNIALERRELMKSALFALLAVTACFICEIIM